MGSRIELQAKLEELLGSRNVYYQPPMDLKMGYPAIVYSKSDIRFTHADNSVYTSNKCYECIVIDRKPDNNVIEKLSHLPYCRFSRHYKADNLNHDVFIIYY